jgi:signal transduction histidine kinase
VAPRRGAQHLWGLRDRLGERQIADLITAYRDGATAASSPQPTA